MSEWKIIKLFKRHMLVIITILAVFAIAGYFVNVIFFENKKDVISVLVLETVADTEVLEKEIGTVVEAGVKEEIHIQSIDFDLGANEAIATTWLRSGTIDVIIGREDQIAFYEEAGYLEETQRAERGIAGVDIEDPAVALTANMSHEENARAVLELFSKKR